jgi:Ty3 transposon capsid-like protein
VLTFDNYIESQDLRDSEKLSIFVSFMEGPAIEWFLTFKKHKRWINNPSYGNLRKEMEEAFDLPFNEDNSLTELEQLRMTKGLAVFVQQFRDKLAKVNVQDKIAKMWFHRV